MPYKMYSNCRNWNVANSKSRPTSLFISSVCIISCSSLCSLSEEHLMGPSIFFCLSVDPSKFPYELVNPHCPGSLWITLLLQWKLWLLLEHNTGTVKSKIYWLTSVSDHITKVRMNCVRLGWIGLDWVRLG